MTTSEFQSHLIKLDTTFRGDKALNTGKRPPNTEDEFVHLQSRALMQLRKQLQDDQLQTESLLVSRHRQLLMTDFVINESTVNCWWYNPRGPPEAATQLFPGEHGSPRRDEFVMVSSPDMLRSVVERNLLRDERPLLLDELQISSSNIGAQGGGVDTLKHLAPEVSDAVLAGATDRVFFFTIHTPSRQFWRGRMTFLWQILVRESVWGKRSDTSRNC